MADHPMSNPRSFPVACGGCGRRKFPEHRWDPARYPFSWCYPPKQGALMSEIIHAKAGLVVFPHAHPPSSSSSSASASASANLGYPVSVVRQIINSVEREEETANANPAPRADADLLIERKSREDAAAADARKKSMPPPIQKLSTSVSSRLGLANTQTERELDAAVRAFDRDMRETDETDHPAADPNIGAALRDLCDMRRQKGGGGGGEGQ